MTSVYHIPCLGLGPVMHCGQPENCNKPLEKYSPFMQIIEDWTTSEHSKYCVYLSQRLDTFPLVQQFYIAYHIGHAHFYVLCYGQSVGLTGPFGLLQCANFVILIFLATLLFNSHLVNLAFL